MRIMKFKKNIVKNVNKLYVTDHKDHWIGTVTKGTILDNVINL